MSRNNKQQQKRVLLDKEEEPKNWSESDSFSEELLPPSSLKRCLRPTTAATQARASKKQSTLQTKCLTDDDIIDNATPSQDAPVEAAGHFVMVLMPDRPVIIDTSSIDPETGDVGIKIHSIESFIQFYGVCAMGTEEKAKQSLATLPRYEAIVCNPDTQNVNTTRFLNLWQGFSLPLVEITKEESEELIQPFLDHLCSLCSNESVLYEYVLKWLAHSIQRPDQTPGTALVLRGHNAGEDVIPQVLKQLFGRHFKQTYGLRPVNETVNQPTMWDGLFLFCKDADQTERKTSDHLHRIVTHPMLSVKSNRDPDDEMIRPHTVLKMNRFHVVLTTSNPDHVFGVSTNIHRARAYVYLDGLPSAAKAPHPLEEECDLAALLCYFTKHVDITTFDPKEVPMTSAWLEVAKSGQLFTPLEQWLYGTLLCSTTASSSNSDPICSSSSDGDTRTIQKKDLHSAYLKWIRDTDHGWKHDNDFCSEMKQTFPHATLSRSQPGDSNRYFTFGSLQQMREDFARRVKVDVFILWPRG